MGAAWCLVGATVLMCGAWLLGIARRVVERANARSRWRVGLECGGWAASQRSDLAQFAAYTSALLRAFV